MNFYSIILFLAQAVILVVSLSASNGNVVILDDDDYQSVLDSADWVFLDIYAQRCGHCVNLAPEWEKLADMFVKSKPKLIIAKLDAEKSKAFIKAYPIRYYPTIYLFKKGEKDPTELPRTVARKAEDLARYLTESTGLKPSGLVHEDSSVFKMTPQDFDATVRSNYVMMNYFAPWCGNCKNMAETYEKLAKVFTHQPGVIIAKVDCTEFPEFCSEKKIQAYPTILSYYNSTEPFDKYHGNREIYSMLKYVNEKAKTARRIDGTLEETFARHEALDDLAKKMMETDGEAERQVYIQKTESLISKLPYSEWTKFYLIFMKRVLEKGKSYIPEELSRIEGILAKGGLNPQNIDSFTIRSNILRVFAGKIDPLSRLFADTIEVETVADVHKEL